MRAKKTVLKKFFIEIPNLYRVVTQVEYSDASRIPSLHNLLI